MSLFQLRPPPGQLGPGPALMWMLADTGQQLQRATCGDPTRSGAGLQHARFQGFTPISIFSFQLPQAKVWGVRRGSVKQPCCKMTDVVRRPELPHA